MKLEDLETQLDKLYLPKMQRKAILGIIDLKVDYEMRNIISEIKGEFKAVKSEISSLKWLVGIVVSVLAILITVLLGIIKFS